MGLDRKMQRRKAASGVCEHKRVAWQAVWRHDAAGGVDVRGGGCRDCGKGVRQLHACRALTRTGRCEAALADPIVPGVDLAPAWKLATTATRRPWWSRFVGWLFGFKGASDADKT